MLIKFIEKFLKFVHNETKVALNVIKTYTSYVIRCLQCCKFLFDVIKIVPNLNKSI